MAKEKSQEGRQMLAGLIDGRNDDEIVAGIERRGPEVVLERVFHGMCDAFLPAKAGDTSAVIGYEVRVGKETYLYHLKIGGGKCKMVKGAPKEARMTFVCAVPVLLRVMAGKQNGMLAFMTGKLKLRGDILFARTFETWFQQG